MASRDATRGSVAYRTVKKSPAMMGRTVGPLFSKIGEAKAVTEDFAENGLNATPIAWRLADDDRGTVEMVPAPTRHTLAIEPVTVHESAEEVTPPKHQEESDP